MWWRVAWYGWGYPSNPDKLPDSVLCPEHGPLFKHSWDGSSVAVTYKADVPEGETCIACGERKHAT